jgi:hypothetical protein
MSVMMWVTPTRSPERCSRIRAPARLPLPGRLQPRPGQRKPIRGQAHVRYEIEIRLPPVVVITRDIASLAPQRPARRVREGIPDGLPATAFGRPTLDLVRGRRRTPGEARRKGGQVRLAETRSCSDHATRSHRHVHPPSLDWALG